MLFDSGLTAWPIVMIAQSYWENIDNYIFRCDEAVYVYILSQSFKQLNNT